MSEFERELLNKVSPHDRTHNGNELFLGGVIAEHFKDWQPPREHAIDTDELSVEKLQEQLNTAKMALISIKWRTERDELETYYVERNHDIHKDAIDALAAIGGCDE